MTENRDIVLKLVRMAMGWESDFSLPEKINWSEVLDLAFEQGVATIIMDGYEVYLSNKPGTVSFLKIPENKPLRAKALGRISTTENTNQNHLSALRILAEALNGKGIPFLIMKGFSCARYYPIPNHRGCSDIDIYPGLRFDESNNALESSGIHVETRYYRHYVSRIKGVMIENHRVLGDLRGPRRQTRALEAQLEHYAKRSIEDGDTVIIQGETISGGRFPLADFNALFLPWHVSAHFEFERVTIRHLLDWALFLVHDGGRIDTMMFKEAKQKYSYGFSKIADILTNLSLRYLNIPSGDIPPSIVEDAIRFDNLLSDRFFNYMFTGEPRKRDANVWRFRFNNLQRIWKERWKYQRLYDLNVLSFIYYKIIGVLFNDGEDD